MVDISSFSLATLIAKSAPTAQQAAQAKESFSLVMEEPEKFQLSGNSVGRFDGESFKQVLSTALTISRETDAEITKSSIVIAGSYLLSALDSVGDSRIGLDIVTRDLLTLAKLASVNEIDIKSGFKGGFPEDVSYDLAFRIFDGSSLSDETLMGVSSYKPFPEPRDIDVDFANRVLSSSAKSLEGDLLALNSSIAVQALGIKEDQEEVSRLFSALVRLSSDFSGVEDSQVPSPKEIAERLASDMVIQARAALILNKDAPVPDVLKKIRDAAESSDRIRQDLENEAQGKFHLVSKGSSFDLRQDLSSGVLLSSSMKIDITLSASQAAMFSKRENAPLVEGVKSIINPVRIPDTSMGF